MSAGSIVRAGWTRVPEGAGPIYGSTERSRRRGKRARDSERVRHAGGDCRARESVSVPLGIEQHVGTVCVPGTSPVISVFTERPDRVKALWSFQLSGRVGAFS